MSFTAPGRALEAAAGRSDALAPAPILILPSLTDVDPQVPSPSWASYTRTSVLMGILQAVSAAAAAAVSEAARHTPLGVKNSPLLLVWRVVPSVRASSHENDVRATEIMYEKEKGERRALPFCVCVRKVKSEKRKVSSPRMILKINVNKIK